MDADNSDADNPDAGNPDAGNPDDKRGWRWVMVTAVVTLFLRFLGRSAAAAIEPLDLQQQLFAQWQQCQEGTIDGPSLRRSWRPIRQSFEALPQLLLDLGLPAR